MITALVRSGAVERGEELFAAGGYNARAHDPAALAVKGRLLKARGLAAKGAERRALLAEAARAYSAADALSPAPYLAINAATLHLLAGEADAAIDGAQAVLALLDAPETSADTPYFLAATRAEALLLLGDRSGAKQALAAAAQHDPDGWDDRACTLAQLRLIATAQGQDGAWLDAHAPPNSLHFAGHMGLASGGSSEARLTAWLGEFLADSRPGFAWGALAAGADLVIAEHLLALGCELHAVLPCPPTQFEAQSVAPAGAEWAARFRAVLDRCASLRVAGQIASSAHDPLATAFAGELAIGGAVLNAARYGSAAEQLIVCDEHGGGANTARQAELWRAELGVQHRIAIPRDVSVEALFPPEQPDAARQLALVAAIGIDELAGDALPGSLEIAGWIAPVAGALSALPAGTVRAAPGRWELATTDVEAGLAALAAVTAACRAAGTPLPAIGAHLAICTLVRDPASGAALAYGSAPDLARRLMQHAPSGVILGSEALAVALAARPGGNLASELYLPDEPELDGSAYLLRPRDQ